MNKVIQALLISFGLLLVASTAIAQSLRDQYQREQMQKQIQDRQHQEALDRSDAIKREVVDNGFLVTCDHDDQMIFYRGNVWSVQKDTIRFPANYSNRGGVIKWKSSVFNISFELYLNSMEKYSSLGNRSNCKVTRGSVAVL